MAHDGRSIRISGHERWDPLTPDEVLARFAAFDVPWWIAGGIAIDLFLGWETRQHDDIDLEMFRDDRATLFEVFPGWDLHAAQDDGLTPWTEHEPLDAGAFAIWGRPHVRAPWAVEILLASGHVDEWRFRGNPSITMTGDRLVRTTRSVVPYCTPEVQLLYKSKRARPKDDVDLARCLHRMAPDQIVWLRNAVGLADAGHPWVAVLDQALVGTSGGAPPSGHHE